MRESFRNLPSSTQKFSIALPLVYLSLAGWAFPHSHLLVVAGLTAVFVGASLVRPIPNPSGGSIFPNNSVKIVAALIWSAPDVLLGVGIGSFLGLLVFRKNELWRASNNGAGWGLATTAAAFAGQVVASQFAPGLLRLIVAAIAIVVTNRVVNEGIFSIYRYQRLGFPFVATWRQNVLDQWASQILAAPMAIILAGTAIRLQNVWLSLGLTAVSAVALPIPRQELAYYHRSQQAVAEIVEAVVRVLEGVDPDARAHGDRIGALAAEVGRRFRMSEERIRSMSLAAQLHDVGLLAGQEGAESRDHHVTAGSRILARFPDPLVARIVEAHHERWDGTGIPTGKRGRRIPLATRILTAVETYDEICHGAYDGVAHSQRDAVAHLRTLAGSTLDPSVVEALVAVLGETRAEPVAAR
ncbi:MAG TPA: HD domain-containing phosphohydrolase [bacterium]|nr:HD domain-containing phosphohydrolase [bacterium]